MTIREMMAMYHSLQFVEELLDYIGQYPDDDYMTMECLCRKLVKHRLLDKADGYYQTHDICTDSHECVKDTHDKTENSSEIPNNFDKDINVRSKDEPQIDGILFKGNLKEGDYKLIKTTNGWVLEGNDIAYYGEPQTERKE